VGQLIAVATSQFVQELTKQTKTDKMKVTDEEKDKADANFIEEVP